MIIAYDRKTGKEVGRYDTVSDLRADYPEYQIVRGKVLVEEP